MAREKCGLLAVPHTVPVSRVVTRTLRMSLLQSHSRVKHIPPSLSTDVTVTVNCNSLLEMRVRIPQRVQVSVFVNVLICQVEGPPPEVCVSAVVKLRK